MRKCKIDNLCDEINKLNGNATYPQMGYLYYADIKGDGRNIRKVYVITNVNGGVTAVHNGATAKATIRNLESIRDYFLNKGV
jgi:hypothetical protein